MTCNAHGALANLPRPSVSVNGVIISNDEIAHETQNHPARTPIAAWTLAARALVVRELLLARARELGVKSAPVCDAAGRREPDEEALIRAVVEHDVRLPEADEATCRRFYEKNLTRFRSPDILEAAHILIAARHDDEAKVEVAQSRAAALLAAIAAGEVELADAARQHSDCPSGASGGVLGQITAGDATPEFEAALQQLQPGEMSAAPVSSRYGFHIIRLDRRIAGGVLPFEAVRSQVADHLTDRVQRHALAQYVRILLTSADVRGIEMSKATGALVQ